MLPIREHHELHKNDLIYSRTLTLFITELLKERIRYIERMCFLFVVVYHIIFVLLGIALYEIMFPFQLFFLLPTLYVIFTLGGTHLAQWFLKKNTKKERALPEINNLCDTVPIYFLPLYVMKLSINDKDVKQLGNLFNHKLTSSMKLADKTSWNEVGLVIGLLATRLCLLNMLKRVSIVTKQ